jgi:CO dehydrogenase maturation factor
MTITLAFAGKGGVGKTTLAALTIRHLVERRAGPVLAVDADPSSNLHLLLGMELEGTVADIREDMLAQVKQTLTQGGAAMGTLPGGMTKREYLAYHIRAALTEGEHVDLLAMGRGEGPGCYCAVNHNLREVLDAVSGGYAYVVIDNEAGLEHLSRRTTRNVQHLLIVSDPTPRGLITAERVAAFRHQMDIEIKNAYLVINRHSDNLPQALRAHIQQLDFPLAGIIPPDEALCRLELAGRPIWEMSADAPSARAVGTMLDALLASVAPNGL